MKKLLLLFLLIIAVSCSKTEDDTRDTCTMNCTTLSGNFITVDNKPLAGIEVSFSYHIGSQVGSYTRKIAKTKTNSKGDYSVDFHLNDSELGNAAPGYFIISVDDKNLDPNEYFRLGNNAGLGYDIHEIKNRDTIINASFYIAKKTNIKVHLNNFIPLKEGDFFEVKTYFSHGIKNENLNSLESFYSYGSGDIFKASVKNQASTITAAEGEKNNIVISRRKNGITFENEIHEVFIPANNQIELTFDY
ncbi:hypothetical protein AR687_13010 [Flavobacteriaceae bacterium CRH]|nr:hypothetical protein AR687_13010 [Flavobacteriaceae bacterium CRH]